jgi:hypothetical protein
MVTRGFAEGHQREATIIRSVFTMTSITGGNFDSSITNKDRRTQRISRAEN